jgi:hypothetical protein
MMTNLALAEFRILTSNTDAEYGNYSGGLINVVTKVGGNAFHGSAFEFLRNTNLDAKSYFAKQRSVFQQNQYGGTIDGPIRRNKLFFFADYQGQHTKQGQDTGVVAVPSLANRAGNFSDSPAFNGTVNGPFLAQTLTNLLGRQVSQGEPFSSVFPGNVIPQTAFSGTGKNAPIHAVSQHWSEQFRVLRRSADQRGCDSGGNTRSCSSKCQRASGGLAKPGPSAAALSAIDC